MLNKVIGVHLCRLKYCILIYLLIVNMFLSPLKNSLQCRSTLMIWFIKGNDQNSISIQRVRSSEQVEVVGTIKRSFK